MISRKIFVITIILSLAGHIIVLALSGFLGGNGHTDGGDVFTVSLEKRLNKTGETPNSEKNALRDSPENIRKSTRSGAVDTIDLDSTDTRYYPYLLQVKQSIDRKWSYPDDAFARGEGGTTVVEFSIVEKGILAASRVITSSGYGLLDAESLHAIRSAAPFSPFPTAFDLAKLNIVAKFRYTLGD
ncbi:MAG: energy transducer TonB [Deltaproteobacteria bacterium]|nr:energy transducer TonB [Deltaproteobacteria bacterium]